MKSKSTYVLLIMTALSLSCKKDSGTNAPITINKIEGVLPLVVGNTWQFRRTTFDTTGAVFDSSIVTMTVGGKKVASTEIGYELNHFPVFVFEVLMVGATDIWSNKADGLYRIVGNPAPFSPFVEKILSYPNSSGDSSRLSSGYIVKTIALNEKVVVPAGSFSCVRYDIFYAYSPGLKGQIYVVPNIGIVKAVSMQGSIHNYVDELESYQLH